MLADLVEKSDKIETLNQELVEERHKPQEAQNGLSSKSEFSDHVSTEVWVVWMLE